MKLMIADAEIVVRKTVTEMGLANPYTFDVNTMLDASAQDKGRLLEGDTSFFLFNMRVLNTQRVGPTKVAPTRVFCDLDIAYYTKSARRVADMQLLETIASHFAEKTLDDVRFRTYTPYPEHVESGFTAYNGVIDFDFDLYRGS